MKRKVVWTAAAACVLLLGTVLVQRWPTARAQPLPEVAVEFVSGSYTVGEADGTVTITVTLSESSSSTVTVDYATSDGTAVGGADYQPASGVVTFAPYQTSKTVVITIINDPCAESTEAFIVTLSNPSGASLGTTTTTTVTIMDNDS